MTEARRAARSARCIASRSVGEQTDARAPTPRADQVVAADRRRLQPICAQRHASPDQSKAIFDELNAKAGAKTNGDAEAEYNRHQNAGWTWSRPGRGHAAVITVNHKAQADISRMRGEAESSSASPRPTDGQMSSLDTFRGTASLESQMLRAQADRVETEGRAPSSRPRPRPS